MARHVKYLALAHEGKILASHLHWDKEAPENYEDVLRQIFNSPGWAAVREQSKKKLELRSGSNIYCIEIDPQGRVYVAVITNGYPIKLVFSSSSASASSPGTPGGAPRRLMADFTEYVTTSYRHESLSSPEKGLKRSLRPFLKELATRYDDLETMDKLTAVNSKVASTLDVAGKVMQKLDERQALLERTHDRSASMAESSKRLFSSSGVIRRSARRKRWCVTLVVVLFILVIAAAIVLGLNFGVTHWF